MVPSARRDIRASGNNMKKKTKSGAKEAKGADSPSRLIDARIKKLGDWRGETLARVRSLIKDADPDVVEEVKWRKPSNSMLGVPVWALIRAAVTLNTSTRSWRKTKSA